MSFSDPLYRDEKLFQSIFEALPAGLLIANRKGQIVMANAAVDAMFGYDPGELVNKPIEHLIPLEKRASHQAQRERYLASPKPRPMAARRDLYVNRKNGEVFPVDISLHPVELDGELFVLANIFDATERRRLEEERLNRVQQELRLSESRMRFLVENLPAGAVYVDRQTLFVNRAVEYLTGYQAIEIGTVGDWFRVLCGPNHAASLQKYQAVKEAGFREECVLSIVRKDGVQRELRIAGHRYDHHEVWLVTDITELYDAQTKLVQAERLAAIGQMVTGLAHESRNALQRARGCLDLLELDLEDQSEQLDLIARIRRSLGDLQHNYEEVRQYAAPILLRRDRVLISKLVESAFENLLCEYRGAKHRLLFEQRDHSEMVCDSHRMSQVFRNVMENAMAAAPAGVTLRVSISDMVLVGKSVRSIELSDDGPGMPPSSETRCFEPFFTTKQSGTGLGLPICQRIVSVHGGTISIRSEVDRGTRVTVVLPLQPVAVASQLPEA
ncbi:PAS domain S-box protein [Novipirellula artificiosorum]|uniref:histidine kinase n=1 Tax=Novipirellula artificiosorum TaxID=2528016 RepID=A0A5C6DWX5_9BACT|nr:PAS domain S-box protein [Novipirellula artificiosorum]TWU40895.1 Sporulation kinase E [Novipirellula artificiosorum]